MFKNGLRNIYGEEGSGMFSVVTDEHVEKIDGRIYDFYSLRYKRLVMKPSGLLIKLGILYKFTLGCKIMYRKQFSIHTNLKQI